jgi:outer membrane biosynthesis protein TonB
VSSLPAQSKAWQFLKTRPIILAIALSLLIHAALLFGPKLIELPAMEVQLPPLTAKLEPLPAVKPSPKLKSASRPKQHIKPKPATPPKTTPPETTPPETIPPETPSPETSPPEVVNQEIAEPAPESSPPAVADAPAVAAPDIPAVEAKPAHPLPKQAQLTFIAYKGTNFSVGEARHRLEIKDDGSYTLQVGMNTTGIASLFKTYELNQQSSGTVSARGLHPNKFSENKTTSSGKQTLTADFDWQNKQLNFSSGNTIALPELTQDFLSFLYQLSQLPLDQEHLSMYVSNGKKLENYQLTVGSEEEIQTRLGKLRVLPLRKGHAPGEEGLEIWLGLEYRLLPVKIRQIDRRGEIAGEMVISDIRVSED